MKKIFLILFVLLLSGCGVKQPPIPGIALSVDAIQTIKEDDQKGYWIEVQIPQRKVILAKGDHIINDFPVAVGMPSYPTPVGYRKIKRVIWNPWWYPPKTSDWVTDPTPVRPRTSGNPLGEIKMPLGHGYLIHGTRAVDSIGGWASHGCIRMLSEDLFGLVRLILKEYSDESAVEQMQKANGAPSKSFENKLEKDVPVVLTYNLVRVHDGYVTISPDLYKRYKRVDQIVYAEMIHQIKNGKDIIDPKKVRSIVRELTKNRTIHRPLENFVRSGVKL